LAINRVSFEKIPSKGLVSKMISPNSRKFFSSLHFLCLFGAGAALVILIQPMVGKLLLPKLGGGPHVWTACLLFFQTGLLMGYGYAHLASTRLKDSQQRVLHCVLLLVSMFGACFTQVQIDRDAASESTWWIALELFRTLGLPYILLASTSPLLSSWTERSNVSDNSYHWYIASNLGSLFACLIYPIGIEPWSTLSNQLLAWRFGYLTFAILFLFVTWTMTKNLDLKESSVAAQTHQGNANQTSSASRFFMWSLWSACTSILLAAATSKISQIGAIVPVLWILPLAIYLASWSVAFWVSWLGRFKIGIPAYFVAGLVACSLLFLRLELNYLTQLFGYLFFVGVTCLVCHSQLYASRPETNRLTSFYLAIAFGGAMGSGFTAIVAPVILNDYYELHLGIALGAILLAVRFTQMNWNRILSDDTVRRVTFPAVILMPCFLILLLASHASFQGDEIVVRKLRDGYGVVTVVDNSKTGMRAMLHGGTQHGLQPIQGELSTEDTLYYRSNSGVGLAIEWVRNELKRPLQIGVVGLGTGSLSLYAREEDSIVYYEISPAVCTTAQEEFRYLSLHKGLTSIRLGDGRALLAKEQSLKPHQYDVLIADAFSNDSLPMHLLTKEAIELYRASVAADGLIAIHVTNRNLDLAPIVIASATELGIRYALVESTVNIRWVVLFPDAGSELPDWANVENGVLRTVKPWTDDYGSLYQAIP